MTGDERIGRRGRIVLGQHDRLPTGQRGRGRVGREADHADVEYSAAGQRRQAGHDQFVVAGDRAAAVGRDLTTNVRRCFQVWVPVLRALIESPGVAPLPAVMVP